MKKLLDIFGWIAVIFTICSVIFTLLTTYLFIYIPFFNGYYTMQIGILMTMIYLALRYFFFEVGKRRLIYVAISLFFIACCIYFIFSGVH